MFRRLVVCVAAALASFSMLFAQRTVKNPYVEQSYQSEFGSIKVLGVLVEDYTYILLEDHTYPSGDGLWISLSSETRLTYGGNSMKVVAWGVWDGQDIQYLDLDEQYSQTPGETYTFAILFPKIPSSVNKFSVEEPGGFYWRGIHMTSGRNSGNGIPDNRGRRDDGGNPWSDGGRNPYTPRETPFTPNGSGTCFALNSNGYLATCYHVVEGARQIRIRGINGDFDTRLKAEVVACSRNDDLAILKISDPSFTGLGALPYAIRFRSVDVGEQIFVLGYPLMPIMGEEVKLSNGLISSSSGYQGDQSSYQISAQVQPGNSGGPLFDADGNVVGVVNARLAVESVSYAVKSTFLKKLAESNSVSMSSSAKLSGKPLSEQVKALKNFTFIIEVQ